MSAGLPASPRSGPASPDGIEATGDGTRQALRSPEQVLLHLPIAGPTSRILAYAIDAMAILLLQILVVIAFLAFATSTDAFLEAVRDDVERWLSAPEDLAESFFFGLMLALLVAAQLLSEWAYFVGFEMALGGRSPGKAALGLRVVRDGGLPLTLRASLVRNLLRIADMLPLTYLVGLIAMLTSREGKRLGDLAAGTLVVRLDRPAPARPLGPVEPESAFHFDRAALARIGENERALLRQTLRRLEGLESARAELALERATDVLRARLEHAPVPAGERLAFLQALWSASRRR